MAERSQFWTTGSALGDGIALSATQFSEWLRASFTNDKYATEGVLGGVNSELAVSGTATPLTVGTGAAYVNGYYYQNSTSANVSVPTPSNGTTGHRVVLQASIALQTVRIALKSSNDGTSSIPAVQQDSAIWETSLATLSVSKTGVITVTDARDYCKPSPAFVYRRQGSSSTDWTSNGGTSYSPGATRIQTGTGTLVFSSSNESSTLTVTYPQSYTDRPLLFVTILQNAISNGQKIHATVYGKGSSSFQVRARRQDSTSWTQNIPFTWMSIGLK